MQLLAIKTPLLKPGVNLFKLIKSLPIKDKDLLVLSSKVLALSQRRIIDLKTIKPKVQAKRLAKKYAISPALSQMIIKEADQIFGGVAKAILTKKNGYLVANAGIDLSNSPKGKAILWPAKPEAFAERVVKHFKSQKKMIGVIIADSTCQPLRRGTTAQAIAIAGFEGLIDERGQPDLFGKKMRLTFRNLADALATSAQVVMGERKDQKPFCLIRKTPVKFTQTPAKKLTEALKIPAKQCLFRNYHIS